jgi:hypothetical protein
VLSTHSFEVPGELRGAGSTRGSMYGLGGPWRSSERSPTSHLGHVCVGNLGVSKFARASLPGPKFRVDGVGGTVRRDVRLLIPYLRTNPRRRKEIEIFIPRGSAE